MSSRSIVGLTVAALVAGLTWTSVVDGEDTALSLRLVELTDSVFALLASEDGRVTPAATNCGFVITPDGVVVIDSGSSPEHGRKVLSMIRGVTSTPIRWVVNTGPHPWHIFGNQVFQSDSTKIVAHLGAAQVLSSYGGEYLQVYESETAQNEERSESVELIAPNTFYKSRSSPTRTEPQVHLVSASPGALFGTGETIVILPTEGIIFTGELVTNTSHPDLSRPGLNVEGWYRVLDFIEMRNPVVLVPGRGDTCSPGACIPAMRRYLESISAQVDSLAREAIPPDQMASMIGLPFAEDWACSALLESNIVGLYATNLEEYITLPLSVRIPDRYAMIDGSITSSTGFARWSSTNPAGYLELEIEWSDDPPDSVTEVVARRRCMRWYSMRPWFPPPTFTDVDTMLIDGVPAVTLLGEWATPQDHPGGPLRWTTFASGGKLFSVQYSAAVKGNDMRAAVAMQELERIVRSIRFD